MIPVPIDLEAVMSVEGQISAAEAASLAQRAAELPAGRDVVEIGSFRGRSACALAVGSLRGARNAVYAVDPHDEFVGVKGGRFGPPDRAAFYAHLVRLGLGELVRLVALPSRRAARAWDAPTIGLLFIDGDHRYAAVRADFEAWYPRVCGGGWIGLHDADCVDVERLVDEVVASRRAAPHERVGLIQWLRKPRQTAAATREGVGRSRARAAVSAGEG